MPQYEFTGTVKKLLDVFSTPSGFTKREVVVTSEDDRYPQDVIFEFIMDRVSLLDDIQEADRVTVTFDLRSREYNGRYFLSASAWRIQKLDGSGAGSPGPAADAGGADSSGEGGGGEFYSDPDNLSDDMPF